MIIHLRNVAVSSFSTFERFGIGELHVSAQLSIQCSASSHQKGVADEGLRINFDLYSKR